MIKAVLFDLDGTLVNTLDDIADGVNFILEKYGLKCVQSHPHYYSPLQSSELIDEDMEFAIRQSIISSAKIGAEYSEQNIYMSTFVCQNDNWGFYVSPEVGMTFFPFESTDFGFQIAAYYSYATNQNKNIDITGINNVGFKLGIAF